MVSRIGLMNTTVRPETHTGDIMRQSLCVGWFILTLVLLLACEQRPRRRDHSRARDHRRAGTSPACDVAARFQSAARMLDHDVADVRCGRIHELRCHAAADVDRRSHADGAGECVRRVASGLREVARCDRAAGTRRRDDHHLRQLDSGYIAEAHQSRGVTAQTFEARAPRGVGIEHRFRFVSGFAEIGRCGAPIHSSRADASGDRHERPG